MSSLRDVLLVVPQYKALGRFYELPVGMAYISSYLKYRGYNVTVVNENEEMLLRSNYQEWFADIIKRNSVLCIGGLSVHYAIVKSIVVRAKQINTSIITVVGGGLVSSEPELMLSALGCDYVVVGEGEYALVSLLGNLQKGSQKFRITDPDLVENLDLLPFPDYDSMQITNYLDRQLTGDEFYLFPENNPRMLPLISSRSCPFNCTFCFHPLGQKYRQRSMSNISDEIELLKSKYNINILIILDELVSADESRLSDLCVVLKKFDLKWLVQMRVSNMNRDILKLMKESGCFELSLGIEHIDDGVLRSMQKYTTEKEIQNALDMAYEAGIGIQGNILFGDPAETGITLMKALEWWRNNIKFAINISHVIPYPGSQLYKRLVSEGHIQNKLNYIESGCPFVNAYYKMPENWHVADHVNQFNHLRGTLVEKKPTRVDKYRGQLFDVKAKCFHCGHENFYKDLYAGATGSGIAGSPGEYRIGCKRCNQRFDFPLC